MSSNAPAATVNYNLYIYLIGVCQKYSISKDFLSFLAASTQVSRTRILI